MQKQRTENDKPFPHAWLCSLMAAGQDWPCCFVVWRGEMCLQYTTRLQENILILYISFNFEGKHDPFLVEQCLIQRNVYGPIPYQTEPWIEPKLFFQEHYSTCQLLFSNVNKTVQERK